MRHYSGPALLPALAVSALCLGLPACKSRQRAGTDAPSQPHLRNAEAYDLSLRAQRAQKDGKPEQAIDLYRRALELNPNMPGAWNNLGVLLMEKRAYLDAVEALRREADLAPSDPRPYTNVGVAYMDAGFAEKSLTYHQMALDRDANWLDALRGVALASKRLNKADDRVLDALKRALMLERDPAWRTVFETERLRVEGQIREQQDPSRSPPAFRKY